MENRKTGQTTRQINKYIKDMIDNPGLSYQIVDHYNDVHNNSIMVKRIEHRLQNEYPNMIDVYHSMDNYGAMATGTNIMSVRYSSCILVDRDIFIGRVVDEVIESLFHNMNKPVNILECVQQVYKDNSKVLFPKLNKDFCDKVIKHTSDRLKYEHGIINVDDHLSSEYDISKEPTILVENRYFARHFVMTLHSPDFLDKCLTINTDKLVNDLDIFKEYLNVSNVCVPKENDYAIHDNANCIRVNNPNLTIVDDNLYVDATIKVRDDIGVGVTDKFEELEKMVEELENKLNNKDRYKMPDYNIKYDEFNLFK